MAQTLHPLYGSPINDSEVSRSVALPAGVYEGLEPIIAGAGGAAGWTASLGVDTRSGRSLWRTPGDLLHGRYIVEEDAAVQLPIDGPGANPRIDLIIGIHKWAAGPIDSVTMVPTGELTAAQRPAYAVVKGTPAATPADPAVADPYNVDGRRAVILARVRIPTAGAATIERYDPTDLRLDYMRALCTDIVQARAPYPSLKQRIDALGSATQIQTMDFRGPTANTGSYHTYATFAPSTSKVYGSAVSQRTATTFGLMSPGLYEILALHKIEQGSDSESAIRCFLVYNGGTPIQIDSQGDTSNIEVTQAVYAQVYVDPSWTDPYIYFERGGTPAGTLRGSIKYLGTPLTLQPLGISTGNLTIYESGGQTYPDGFIQNLRAANAVGAVTWAVVSGGGARDGTTEPKAEIVNGNQLKLTWAAAPGSYPASYTVTLQATDSASVPRVATKTITVTLNAAQALSITNSDLTVTPSSYPYTVTFEPLASGGTAPYTWALVAGADTTLTGAAYSTSTGLVGGTVSANGTVKVRLRVTDGAATQVEKVVNITSTLNTGGSGSGGGGCVPAGTLFETVDGPIPVEALAAGMLVRAYDDATLEPVEATIEEVFVYEARPMANLHTEAVSLRCSQDHRVYRKESRKTRGLDPHWPPVEELLPGDRTLVEVEPGVAEESVVLSVDLLDLVETVYHVRLSRGHVYVAGGVLAHNLKAPSLG